MEPNKKARILKKLIEMRDRLDALLEMLEKKSSSKSK